VNPRHRDAFYLFGCISIDDADIGVGILIEPNTALALTLRNLKVVLRACVCNVHREFTMFFIAHDALPFRHLLTFRQITITVPGNLRSRASQAVHHCHTFPGVANALQDNHGGAVVIQLAQSRINQARVVGGALL
jgi:hypothetical protein